MRRYSLTFLALAVLGLGLYYTTGAAVESASAISTASQSKKASSAKPDAKVEQELIRAEEESLDAWLRKDVRKMGELLADNYSEIDFEGKVNDRARALELVANPPMKFDSIKLSDFKVSAYGDVAVVTGLSTATGPISGQARFTDVWVKQGGKWKLTHSQGTLVQGTVTGLPKQ
jgi:hypothetical protein